MLRAEDKKELREMPGTRAFGDDMANETLPTNSALFDNDGKADYDNLGVFIILKYESYSYSVSPIFLSRNLCNLSTVTSFMVTSFNVKV